MEGANIPAVPPSARKGQHKNVEGSNFDDDDDSLAVSRVPTMSSTVTHPCEVSLLHAMFCNSRMSDVYPSLALGFNPF